MFTLIKSYIIGICAILPGVSGSVIAVSFGIYEKLLNIISEKKYKDNILFLLLVFIGITSGIFMTSSFIMYIFKYKTIIYYILIGIILSEVPFLIKKIHIKGNIKKMPLVLAFLFSLILDIINKKNYINEYSYFKSFIGGILFAFGKVFPGVSSSFFLLCLGIYEDIIILLTNPFLLYKKIDFYLPFIIGTIVGILIFVKLLSYLLKKHYEFIYSIIIGFIISSVIVLFPKFSLDIKNIMGIVLMCIFFVIFIYVKKKND